MSWTAGAVWQRPAEKVKHDDRLMNRSNCLAQSGDLAHAFDAAPVLGSSVGLPREIAEQQNGFRSQMRE